MIKKLKIYISIIIIFIVGVLLFISFSYSKKRSFNLEGIRTEIKDSIKKIDKCGKIVSNAVGIFRITPSQWYTQQWILQNASREEFLKLTDYPSGAVKAIAYEGLLRDKKFEGKIDLINKSLNDTLTFVFYQCGCIETGLMLSDYVINHIGNLNNEFRNIKDDEFPKFNFSDNQIEVIKSKFRKRKRKRKRNLEYYKKEYYKTIK